MTALSCSICSVNIFLKLKVLQVVLINQVGNFKYGVWLVLIVFLYKSNTRLFKNGC